jgi:type IV pilus assembly protein PilM
MGVGLDIGSKTIKVVELGGGGKRFILKAAGAVGYSNNIDIESIQDEKELANLAKAIKALFNDAKISSNKVSIAIPENKAYTRILKLPLLNDEEVASAVKWEAEELIPIPIKEAIIQHQVIERQEAGNPPQVVVLLVAVQKELVEKYMKMLRLVGLNVVGVETNLLSLVRSVSYPNKVSIIADIGAYATNIAIAKSEQLVFSRSISTAGSALTRAVAQSLGVSLEQAEQYKRTYGFSEGQLEGKVGDALTPILRVIIEETKKAINYYQLEVKGDKPSSVILSGGSAGLPGITTVFTKYLDIEVAMCNPFSKIEVDQESAKNLASFAPLYSVAVGLAMRGD